MDALQLHLFYNHVPLIGALAALLVVVIGMVMRNKAVRMVGLAVYVLMALTVVPTYLSGEGAEEKVENIAGINKDVIEEHEELAVVALWLMVAASVAAICAFVALWKSAPQNITAGLSIIFVVLAIAGFVQTALTAHEGGEIRRPDLETTPATSSTTPATTPVTTLVTS